MPACKSHSKVFFGQLHWPAVSCSDMHSETPAYTRMQPLALASFLIFKNSGSSFADGRDHLFADRCVKVVDDARKKLIPHFCMNVCETQDTEAHSVRVCVRADTERSYICVSFSLPAFRDRISLCLCPFLFLSHRQTDTRQRYIRHT